MPLPPPIAHTLAGFLDLLYPPRCLVCERPGPDVLCAPCRARFRPVDLPVCARCGLGVDRSRRQGLCPACAGGAAHYFAAARAAGQFEGTLRQAILRLKYDGRCRLAEPLGEYLAGYLRGDPFGGAAIDVIVPIPLHVSRLRQRGFNQAGLIAEAAARPLCLPVAENALRRVRKTRPQVELSASQRAANIRDAFAAGDAAVRGKAVLLLDDVITTCRTMDEAARVLMNAGAKAVYAVGVARDA